MERDTENTKLSNSSCPKTYGKTGVPHHALVKPKPYGRSLMAENNSSSLNIKVKIATFIQT